MQKLALVEPRVESAKTVAKRLLGPAWRKLRRPNFTDQTFSPSERDLQQRQDCHFVRMGEGNYFEIYWRLEGFGGGAGPTATLYVAACPVLKFDCLGPGLGHIHANLIQLEWRESGQLWMSEQTVEQQIDRALFELENNIYYWLQRNPNAAVRHSTLPETAAYKTALKDVRQTLTQYAQRARQA